MDDAAHPDRRIVIRPSADADVPAMVAIYAHHIARGISELGEYEAVARDAGNLKRRRRSMRRER